MEKFSVSTQWVNVKFNASHIVVGRLSQIPIGLVRAASDSIHSFALCICMKAGGASWGDAHSGRGTKPSNLAPSSTV